MNPEDMRRLSDRGQRALDLLVTRGTQALAVAESWRGNLRASSGGGGSLRVDTFEELVPLLGAWVEHLAFIPHDPTGEADPNTPDQLRHPRLVAAIGALDIAISNVTNLILSTVPREPGQKVDNTPPEGACENCWTDHHYFNPVEHYKKLCRWCGDFKANQGQVPPLALLRLRHAGRRITTTEVDRALGRKAKSA